MSNFSQIPQGRFFKTKDGSTYKKIDQQVYVDVGTGIETYWEPLFDSRIVSPFATPDAPTDPDLKFQVDPQTRLVTPNPNSKNAREALGALWGSALFDCGPEDYEYMVKQCIKWGRAAKEAASKPGVV